MAGTARAARRYQRTAMRTAMTTATAAGSTRTASGGERQRWRAAPRPPSSALPARCLSTGLSIVDAAAYAKEHSVRHDTGHARCARSHLSIPRWTAGRKSVNVCGCRGPACQSRTTDPVRHHPTTDTPNSRMRLENSDLLKLWDAHQSNTATSCAINEPCKFLNNGHESFVCRCGWRTPTC